MASVLTGELTGLLLEVSGSIKLPRRFAYLLLAAHVLFSHFLSLTAYRRHALKETTVPVND